MAEPRSVGEYDVFELIGHGSFGHVYRGVRRDCGALVAIKTINLEEAEEEIESIQQEIALLSQCKSPHVTQYIESFVHGPDLWIVMEYLAGGSIADILEAQEQEQVQLTEQQIATICRAMLHSLEYLHTQDKLHRDIKAANVLLSADGRVKLADFGVSGQLSSTASKRNTVVGTPYWMAPEVIQGEPYDQSADIWSLGITAYEMATGKPPYYKLHAMRALFLIPTKDPPRLDDAGDWSDNFCSFVSACLQKDPSQRPAAAILRNHPFIQTKSEDNGALRDLAARSIERQRHLRDTVPGETPKTASGRSTPAHDPSTPAESGPVWDFGTVRSLGLANVDVVSHKGVTAARKSTSDESAAAALSSSRDGQAPNTEPPSQNASVYSTISRSKDALNAPEHNVARTEPVASAPSHEAETQKRLLVPAAPVADASDADGRKAKAIPPRLEPAVGDLRGTTERNNSVAETLEAVREAYTLATSSSVHTASVEDQLLLQSLQQSFWVMERESSGSPARFAQALLNILNDSSLGTLNSVREAVQPMANPVTTQPRTSLVDASRHAIGPRRHRTNAAPSKVAIGSGPNSSIPQHRADADSLGMAGFLEQRWRSKYSNQND